MQKKQEKIKKSINKKKGPAKCKAFVVTFLTTTYIHSQSWLTRRH